MNLGIFDSGVGGLTVWQELRKISRDNVIYYGDTAHVPYGEKTPNQLLEYFHVITSFFQTKQVDAILVACNTMSAVVVPQMEQHLQIPLFNMIDAAVAQTIPITKGKVGVLATRATAESGAYERAFLAEKSHLRIYTQACPRLVPLIEAGWRSGPEVEQAVHEYLAPLLASGVDTIVLGCTHYPFLLPVIQQQAGSHVKILDPAVQISQTVKQWLKRQESHTRDYTGQTEFYVSGNPQEFKQVVLRFMGMTIPVVNQH